MRRIEIVVGFVSIFLLSLTLFAWEWPTENDFITSFLNKSRSQILTDYVSKTHWEINLESIKEFVDIKKVESRIRKIFSSSRFKKLEEHKKLAIKTFLDTIDGKIKDPF